MSTMINTRIIKIGNSQGIRIPKLILEQTGLEDAAEVELEVRKGEIVVRQTSRPRQNWEAAFNSMAENNDDGLLDEELSANDWDEEEWEW
ncbi:MAG: AbrB/MazE/SpoVT family DNA-binding domain-containing protein [Chloroflexota bacterium]|nr:MAG: AbrB/MazE/SpoVT family DNA-binding domain-containing protein [Chloroflexota bacterium]